MMRHMMKKHALMAMVWLISAPAWAAREGTVAIYSGPCQNERAAIESRGMAVDRGSGETWVVTSHHRVYNGRREQGVCHWVKEPGESSRRHEAELYSWDWGTGMALLRVRGLRGATDSMRSYVYTESPIARLADGTEGELQGNYTKSHHFPNSPATMLDVKGIPVTPELIGSPIYDENDRWSGIVSHQYVAPVVGGAPAVLAWDFVPGHAESQVLAISSSDAYREIWGRVPYRPESEFKVSFEDQIGGRSRVKRDGLYFEEECGPATSALDELERFTVSGCSPQAGMGGGYVIGGGSGGGHGIGGAGGSGGGHGIGGNQGPVAVAPRAGIGSGCGSAARPTSGIAGARGRGVGGGLGAPAAGSTELVSCRIRVYRDEFASPRESGWPLGARLKPLLAKGGTALIPFSVVRGIGDAIVPLHYASLQHFFHVLDVRGIVVLLDAKARAAQPTHRGRDELRREVLELLAQVPRKPTAPVAVSTEMFARLNMALTMLVSENWLDITERDLDEFFYEPNQRSPWSYALPAGRYEGCPSVCPDARVIERYLDRLKRIRDIRRNLKPLASERK